MDEVLRTWGVSFRGTTGLLLDSIKVEASTSIAALRIAAKETTTPVQVASVSVELINRP